MKFNMQSIIPLFLIAGCAASAAQAEIVTRANRLLCAPQNADMSVTTTFSTTCRYDDIKPGDDAVAIVTLNGKQAVHAVCEFSGPDAVALVRPFKHADFDTKVLPGNVFEFDIKYREIADSNDDNQNIHFYLNKAEPNVSDKLTCTFTTLAN